MLALVDDHDPSPDTIGLLAYDGHGSTRQLLNPEAAGSNAFDAIAQDGSGHAQSYDYDAYGVTLSPDFAQSATLPATPLTNLLYSGEQRDADTGLDYLRARYLDTMTGRFNRMDPFAGNRSDPRSLHKYAYAMSDVVNSVDPLGLCSRLLLGQLIEEPIFALYLEDNPSSVGSAHLNWNVPGAAGLVFPDIADTSKRQVGEVKPLSRYGLSTGPIQLATYLLALNGRDFVSRGGIPWRLDGPAEGGLWKPLDWVAPIGTILSIPPPCSADYTVVLVGNFYGVVFYKAFKNPKPNSRLRGPAKEMLREKLRELTPRYQRILTPEAVSVQEQFSTELDFEWLRISASQQAMFAQSALGATIVLAVAAYTLRSLPGGMITG